jgi:xanthine dehydrogenase/oxidase
MAVKDACEQLKARIAPYRDKLPNAPFAEVVKAAFFDRVPLSATGFYKTPDIGYPWQNCGSLLPAEDVLKSRPDGDPRRTEKPARLYHYWTQGVAGKCSTPTRVAAHRRKATEVEVDCLTGHWTILRTDMCMDVGQSLNPAVDYGQIVGAFTQGFGLFTFEESLWLQNGRIFSKGPGNYKIPTFADVPQEMNVWLHKDSDFAGLRTIHVRAHSVAARPDVYCPVEPWCRRATSLPVSIPILLQSSSHPCSGASVMLAIRDALASARKDNGVTDIQPFELPLTCERIRLAVGDKLATQGQVKAKDGEKSFFVYI